MNPKFKMVVIRADSKKRIDYIAKKLKLSKSEALSRIIDSLFEACVGFEGHVNLEISHSVLNGCVEFYFRGQSKYRIGEVSEEEE